MSLNFGKVAVLFGGTSAEREVSLRSGQAVLDALVNQGIDAKGIDPKVDDVAQLKAQGFDRAFIVLHGRGGEDGTIQGLLTYLKIPFTGSNVLSSAITMDKSMSKQIWKSAGLPTAKYKIVTKNDYNAKQAKNILMDLSHTVMVKPVNEGSSIGMAKVDNADDLNKALLDAFKFDSKVLLETWIEGEEYTVSMLDGHALPAIKMSTDNDFYDYNAKYQSTNTRYFCPCGLDEQEMKTLNALAEDAFVSIGCQGWGRVDFMRDMNKQWFLLEINTVPGMTETSLVPKAAKQAGYSFEQLVLKILMQTLA